MIKENKFGASWATGRDSEIDRDECAMPPSTVKMTNLEIEKTLAAEAACDLRTARKALEHGYGTVRKRDVRDRIAFAFRRMPELQKQYSKEHYP